LPREKQIVSMKKVWLIIGIFISIYLVLPGPKLPPPDLPTQAGSPESLKSTEPGDTIQLPRISAYYTNKSRAEAVSFYQNYFSHSSLLNIPLFTYRLNHPPEYVKQVIRDTAKSWYLEEIVHPFRESLFVNGYEGQIEVRGRLQPDKRKKFLVGGKSWSAKVTLRWFPSRVGARLAVFWLAWTALLVILKEWRKEIDGLWVIRREKNRKE